MTGALDINFDDINEPTIAPAGRYDLQVTAAEAGRTGERSKNPGAPQVKVTIGFPDNVDFQNFTHYLGVPNEMDEPKAFKWKALGLKRFLVAFGLPTHGGFDIDQFVMEVVGSTARNIEIGLTDPLEDGRVFNKMNLPPIK